MDPPSRAGRPPGSTTILAENVSCPRPEIDCPTALGRQTDPAESRCGSARLAWQSSAVFQFAFESLRRHRPVDLVLGKLLPVFDRAGRRERIDNPEVDGFSVLLVFPGKGPDVAFDDQLAAPTLAASGGHGVAAVGVVFGVVGEHDQVLRFSVHELVADKKASAAPALVPQRAGFLRRLAVARIEGSMSFALILGIVMAVFVGSQIYWYVRARALVKRLVKTRTARILLIAAGLAAYLALFLVNFGVFGRRASPTRLTWYDALVSAPFVWWVASSVVAFLIAILVWPVRRVARSTSALGSPGRRQFLERTASVVVAAPFVAGAYGLLYGRLNLEITRQRIRLARLPKAFAGFRIAQLSDIHIGPFMTEDQIRKYVRIANDLKPDLIALTGDFVTWDASTQRAVVNALTGLHATFGIFGCLGNHEAWSHTEDSITRMFQQVGIRILRQERVPVSAQGESFNLIGVDFETRRHMSPGSEKFVRTYLE